jgi:hypothetical protein
MSTAQIAKVGKVVFGAARLTLLLFVLAAPIALSASGLCLLAASWATQYLSNIPGR